MTVRNAITISALTTSLLAGCLGNPDRRTLSELHDEEPDLAEVRAESEKTDG